MKKLFFISISVILISCNVQKEMELRSIGITDGAGTIAPTVTTVSPVSYGVKGGIPLTITGTDFVDGATVIIGGTNCPSVVFVSTTQLTCTLPYHFASVVDVVVSNPNGISGTKFGGFSYNSYLYASNQTNPSLLTRMRIDSATGAITSLGTTPVPLGAYGVEIDPTNTWVYTAGATANQIAGFTINHLDGSLTPIPGTPLAAGAGVDGLAVSKDSKCLIASNFNAAVGVAVTSYTINQTSGGITKVADYAGGTNAGFIAIDPTNKFVYVTNYGSNNISAYTLNPTTCTLAIIGTYASSAAPDAVSIHPNGKFLYTGNATNTLMPGSTGGVTVMSINQTTGVLTLVGTYQTSDARNGSGVEIDKTGTQIYVTARGNDAIGAGKVFAYNIDATSGLLTAINNWPTSNGPNDVRILGSGRFVFTANFASNNIDVFVRDLTTGNLTPATPPSYTAGVGPAIIGITF